MKQIFTLFLFLCFIKTMPVSGQETQDPGQEMRAAWLTTVFRLDWPSTVITSEGNQSQINQQKQQLINILNSIKAAGLNAVFLQVRAEADAIYESGFEPWSRNLVATRGMDPGYDPLEFAIDECHKRGLELHAWVNPYRFESTAGKYSGEAGDYRQTNPEWVLTYSGEGSILDPGNPEVRQRITDIIEEIVLNYDIDGIVFDDYFYAYGGTPANLDQYSQEKWKPASMNLGDWRRDNVNKTIAAVYDVIKEHKPWVRFGVAPFGIWTMDQSVASSYGLSLPSGITGLDAYKSIYADAMAWLRDRTVDYISPQIYWPTTSSGQDYKKLAPWWSDAANKFGRHMYVSHSLSSLEPSDYPPPVALKSATTDFLRTELNGLSMLEYFSQIPYVNYNIAFDASEIGLQIYWNRISSKNNAPGSVFFRSSMLETSGFVNYLKSNEYKHQALPPVITWNEKREVSLVSDIHIEDKMLKWDAPDTNVRYAVYAIPDLFINQPGIFKDASYLVGMSYDFQYDLSNMPELLSGHIFAISVIDRNGYEYPPATMGEELKDNQPVTLIEPSNNSSTHKGFSFSWEEIQGIDYYILEVASDSAFSSGVNRLNVTGNTYESNSLDLAVDSIYFWRITSRKSNAIDTTSEVFMFKISPSILYPANEIANVEVNPVIQWKVFDDSDIYHLQIASNSNFSNVFFDQDSIEGDSYELMPGIIFPFSTYYLKIEAYSNDSTISWTDIAVFSTVQTPPSVPVLKEPSEGETISGTEVKLSIEENLLAKSITYQLSNAGNFPWNNRLQYTIDAPGYDLILNDLNDGQWYARARANYGNESTDWSEVISFSTLATDVAVVTDLEFRLYNPFFPSTNNLKVQFSLSEPSKIKLFITSLTGKRVLMAHEGTLSRGKHELMMPAVGLLPGIYLLTLETNEGIRTVKLIKPH